MQTVLIFRRGFYFGLDCFIFIFAFSALCSLTLRADQVVYDDALQNGWQNYSWATVGFANTSPVHGGADSISVSSSGYQALYLHHAVQAGTLFTNLTFWINGGSGGQFVQVQATSNGVAQTAVALAALPVNTWRQETISLTALGVASSSAFDGFWIQVQTGGTAPVFYVDDIALTTNALIAGTNSNMTVQIDAMANRHAISPLIYGVAFASSSELTDLNLTLNRSGGNAETRYNWQINAHNHAADYYFESLPDYPATPGASTDDFVASTRNGGAQAMITIPMIGWAPKLGTNGDGRLASYSIAKYGPQTGNDFQWFPDAGNGISITNNTPITWNNPNDANVPVNSAFQQGYVRHLTNSWGLSTNGGVKFYLMDNEHSIWQSTHQDVHPIGPTMQEIRDKIFDYGSMVKSNDPNALVCAPEEWGWPGYFNSGYDIQNSGGHDRATNGGADYMPWLLSQIHQHDLSTGRRLLDYFTLHCYPQEGNVGSDTVDAATTLLRNQSTRLFWDTNYVDPSWINSVIALIPRMKNWVATNYPGTKIGITEYNWGAESSMNGATAQADLLGIFGREGLDLATRWVCPSTNTPAYNAIKMFRNYDGSKSVFGDTSVSATVTNPDALATFAAVRGSDGALTMMVINKDPNNATPGTLNVTNFAGNGTAQVWQLATNKISQLASQTFTNGIISRTLPAQSLTLLVLPPLPPFSLRPGARSAGQMTLWLDGLTGQSYSLQSSTNLIQWTAISTNTLLSNSFPYSIATTGSAVKFYRSRWAQ